MTHGEIKAMLQRSDPRKLRESQGIKASTICRALTIPAGHLHRWEMRLSSPESFAGYRWAKVIAGLERHAMGTMEMAAMEEAA